MSAGPPGDRHAAAVARARERFFANDIEAAAAGFEAVLRADRNHPDALHFSGVIAYLQHRYTDAIRLIRRAQPLRAQDGELYANLGLALQANGEADAAVTALRRAVALTPQHAELHAMLATALRDAGDLAGARAACELALQRNPACALARFTRAICGLLDGDCQHVWHDHEWRVAVDTGRDYAPDPHRPGATLPRPSTWRAQLAPDSRVLVLGEQGLGDELFFLRYLPILRRQVRWLGVRPAPRLLPLLRTLPLADAWLGADDPLPAVERVVLVGDLPLLCTADTAPAPPPSLALTPAPDAMAAARRRLAAAGPAPYLGLSWRAGADPVPGAKPGRRKQIPPAVLAPALAGWPGSVVSLQRGASPAELAGLAASLGMPVADLGDVNDELPIALATLSLLDEYAGVSNTNMHLRAALGCPVRVLVGAAPDWRWTAQASRSPWFPDFPLYRESRTGGWQAALDTLAQDLNRVG